MKKNVAGQKIGAQMVSATDGSAFTGAVTVSVTGDAGTQATGSVGAGACTHEGNGYHTYAPAQAETNYDLAAFTFTGSGAIPTTVQIFTRPTTGLLAPTVADRTLDVSSGGEAGVDWANVGSPTTTLNLSGTSTLALEPTTAGRKLDVSTGGEAGMDWANIGSPTATVALTGTTVGTLTTYTGNTVQTGDSFARIGAAGAGLTALGDTRIANLDGTITSRMATYTQPTGFLAATFPATVASTTNITGGTITTTTNVTTVNGLAAGVITATSIAADAITAAKIADGAIDAATFAAGAINAAAIAADAIGASELAADAATEIGTAVWASATRTLSALGFTLGASDLAADTITAAKIAADAFTAAKFASDVTTEFQTGLATAASIAALNNLSAAQVNAEVDTALVDLRLDELLAADSDIDGAAPPTVGSVFHELMTKTAGSFTYDQTTDSLEAVRDRGDAAWITATGFSTHSASDVWAVGTRTITGGTITTYTGNTVQTGDSYAIVNSGTHGNAAIKGYVDDIGTAGAGLTAMPWNAAWDAEVQSECADAITAAGISAAGISDAVWDEILSGHVVSGSTGEALGAAGGAGDPWITAIPGSYSAGQAGYILGTNLNATVSSRSTQTSVDTIKAKTDTLPTFPTNFASLAISAGGHVVLQDASLITAKLGTFVLDKGTHLLGFNDLSAAGTRSALGLASANIDTQFSAIADNVWDEALSGHLTAGSVGAALNAAGSAGDPWSTDLPGAYVTGSAGKIIGDNINATISSRAAGTALTSLLTTAMTESYAAAGSVPTPAQAMQMILQRMVEFSISGTTIQVTKRDGSTNAFSMTLDDDTEPTSSTQD